MCRERRANATVVDVLTQRLENEQESCRRQSEVINALRIELAAYQGTQVIFALVVTILVPFCEGCALGPLTRRSQPKVALQQARLLEFVQKCRSRMLLLSGQFFVTIFFEFDLIIGTQ